jgi:hypothetical protein
MLDGQFYVMEFVKGRIFEDVRLQDLPTEAERREWSGHLHFLDQTFRPCIEIHTYDDSHFRPPSPAGSQPSKPLPTSLPFRRPSSSLIFLPPSSPNRNPNHPTALLLSSTSLVNRLPSLLFRTSKPPLKGSNRSFSTRTTRLRWKAS